MALDLKIFSVFSLFIPSYLIRYYRDTDYSGKVYLPCRFREFLVGVRTHQRTSGFLISESYSLAKIDYIRDFNEFDTWSHRLSLVLKLRKLRFSPSFRFAYYINEAKGYDQEGERRPTSDDADISYRRYETNFSLNEDITGKLSVKLKYLLRFYFFTSEKNPHIDPWHVGRRDILNRIELSPRLKVNRRLAFEGKLSYEWRETESEYKEDIDEVKDYRRWNLSFGIVIIH